MKKHFFKFLFLFFYAMPLLMAEQDYSLEYKKGYIYSKLEDRFPYSELEIDIDDQQIIIYAWRDGIDCEAIKFYLESIGSYSVSFDRSYTPSPEVNVSLEITGNDIEAALEGDEGSTFLPALNPFFPTMLAQPHILGYSAGYRCYDKVFKTDCIPVSIGDQFSLYQFKTISCGHLYFGIEACVWAIFEARTKSLSLINADYYIAFPFTYINNNFSARLRFYHQSSHLGDEFLLENEQFKRKNPSMEVVDLSLAYDFNNGLIGFLGYSRVLRSDESYRVKPNSVYYGFNYFIDYWKLYICNVEATPYIAAFFSNQENNHWGLDSSVAIGYQWNKSYGHKLRLYVEGHDGYSAEGQFSKEKTRYVAIKLLYGY